MEVDLSDESHAARSALKARWRPRAAYPLGLSKTSAPFPSWLRMIDSWHRSARSPWVALVDLAMVMGACMLVGSPLAKLSLFAIGLILFLYLSGRYADRSALETQGITWYAGSLAMPLAFATLVGVGVQEAMHVAVNRFLLASVMTMGALCGIRGLAWLVVVAARRRGLGLRRTLIVGDGKSAALITKKLASYPEAGLSPVDSLRLADGMDDGPEISSHALRLINMVRVQEIEEVVLAPEGSDGDEIIDCVKMADGLDTYFSILLPLADVFLHPGLVTQVGGLPLISLGRIAQKRASLPGKRMFDVGLSSLMLLLAAPVLGLVAVAIKVFDGGPVIYRQRRVGRDGKTFDMLKFRSMVVGADRLVVDLRDRNSNTGLLFKIHDDPRITRLGRLLRRLSLDELPQLWNVVRGDMSLVGPRPLAVEPEDFGPIENKRHSVPPGITGYWQIAGGNDLMYEEMIKLDLAYIQNRSLMLDVWLLLRTPAAMLHRRGAW